MRLSGLNAVQFDRWENDARNKDVVMRILKHVYWRWVAGRSRAQAKKRQRDGYLYRIGDFEIEMPPGHNLELHQLRCPRYDHSLGDVAQVMSQKYPESIILDVGANVGDTAALIRTHSSNPIVCVEGCADFIPFLERNVVLLGANVSVLSSFLMPDDGSQPSSIVADGGTARVITGGVGRLNCSSTTLGNVMKQSEGRVGLLKTDLDGGDFGVLRSAMVEISKHKPVIFMEYMTDSDKAESEAIALVEAFENVGYVLFIVYDNSGRFLRSIERNATAQFKELNKYLDLSRRFAPHDLLYLDVCLFHRDDNDLFMALREIEYCR